MSKTYIPQAVTVASATSKYLTRYQSKLTIGATPEQIEALGDLITCLLVFLQKWHKPTPTT